MSTVRSAVPPKSTPISAEEMREAEEKAQMNIVRRKMMKDEREKMRKGVLGICEAFGNDIHRYEVTSWSVSKSGKTASMVTCLRCFKTIAMTDLAEAHVP